MKKQKFFRLISFLLVLSVLVCGCSKKDPNEEGTTGSANTDTPTKEMLYLAKDGAAIHRIVYPLISNPAINEAVASLQQELRKWVGFEFPSSSDKVAEKNKNQVNILIGSTSFASSTEALGKIGKDQFSITLQNGNVVIVAGSEQLYVAAVKQLIADLSFSDGAAAIPADYSYTSGMIEKCQIVSNAATEYVIVYDYKTAKTQQYAQEIQKAIELATGVTVPIKRDSVLATGMREILIGSTDRSFSQASACSYMDYGIFYDASHKSIALTGRLDYAVSKFISMIETDGVNGALAMYTALFGGFTPEGFGTIPTYRDGKYDFFAESDYNSYYVIYNNATPEEYNAYLSRLSTSEGFTEYARNEINGNLFATYTDGYTILTVNYTAYEQAVRIIADTTDTATLTKQQSDCGAVVTTPKLTQINSVCSFLFRLSDGRFIVFDGGMPESKNYNTLYQQLVEQNVLEGKPVIAAWMFSHMHNDHVGTFIEFSSRYAGNVELQNMVLAIPSEEIYSGYGQFDFSDSNSMKNYGIPNVKATLKNLYPNTNIILPHAGQNMWFADAKVEILYTHEDYAPQLMDETNNSSTVYVINLAGQRFVMFGDLHHLGSKTVYRMYGDCDAIDVDFLQVAHHGYGGGDLQMYAGFNAEVALWTSHIETILELNLYNRPDVFDTTLVDENLIMSKADKLMTIPLPYTVGSLPEFARTFD